MRYGHMVRQSLAPLPTTTNGVPSSTATNGGRSTRPPSMSKNAKTLALNVQNSLTKARTPLLAILLLAAPFAIALLMIISGTLSPHRRKLLHVHSKDLEHLGIDSSSSSIRNRNRFFRTTSSSKNGGGSGGGVGGMIKLRSPIVRFDLDKFIKKQRDRHANISQLPPSSSSMATYHFNSSISRSTPVTLIAACRDRHESLLSTYASWSAIQGVDQIVLVEWSDTAYDWGRIPNLIDDEKARRLTIVLTRNIADKWVLSRAYNLAAKFAIFDYILKVDCDTYLSPDFLQRHAAPTQGEYYTVTWGSERKLNEQHLRGIWFARASDFARVGGYDERITGYGYEDVELYERLKRVAGLQYRSIDLDTVRHTVGSNLQLEHDGSGNLAETNGQVLVSKKISGRINKKVLDNLPKWDEIFQDTASHYSYLYDTRLHLIIANASSSYHTPPDPLAEVTGSQRDKLIADVVRTGLHDDFALPWDVLNGVSVEDLIHLANYVDHSESSPHVLVAILQGRDALANTFNLVSALSLAVLRGRPILVVWTLPDDGHVVDSDRALLSDLFDVVATNKQLSSLLSAADHKRSGPHNMYGKHARIIPALKWCRDDLVDCATRYDKAYEGVQELGTDRLMQYYDDEPANAVPISTSRHTVLKLADRTVIGPHDVRLMAMRSLVLSAASRSAQAMSFPLHNNNDGNDENDMAVVVGTEGTAVEMIGESIRKDFPGYVAQGRGSGEKDERKLACVVGRGHVRFRQVVLGRESGDGDRFCANGLVECTVSQVAAQVANVYIMMGSKTVYPRVEKETGQKEKWLALNDAQVDEAMAGDLWHLYKER